MNSPKKRRLLIVDDATYLLFGLRRILADMADEWEMVFIEDPVVALGAAREEPFDVVISDYKMPVMRGTDLVREIKAVTPETTCYIMTGSEGDSRVPLNMNEVSGVIRKPCEIAVLRQAISRAGAGCCAEDCTLLAAVV